MGIGGGETGREILFRGVWGCGAERLSSARAGVAPRHRGSTAAWGLGWGSGGGVHQIAGTFLQAPGGATVDLGTESSLRVSLWA